MSHGIKTFFLGFILSACGGDREEVRPLYYSGKMIRWNQLPIRLVYSEDFMEEFNDMPTQDENLFMDSLKEWDDAIAEKTLFDYDNFHPVSNASFTRCDEEFHQRIPFVNGVYKLYTWDIEESFWTPEGVEVLPHQIVARVIPCGYDNGLYLEINSVDIVFNYEHFNFTTDDTSPLASLLNSKPTVNLRRVFLHEIGHLLGLEHANPGTHSVMGYPYLQSSMNLTQWDQDSLLERYGPPDSFATRTVPPYDRGQHIVNSLENLILYDSSIGRKSP